MILEMLVESTAGVNGVTLPVVGWEEEDKLGSLGGVEPKFW